MPLTVRGRRLSLRWLLPPPVPPDGNMSLYDHLRELRYRLLFSVVAVIIGIIVCWNFYDLFYRILQQPYLEAVVRVKEARPELEPSMILEGVIAPFMLQLMIVALAALIVTCPVWIYQLWAFVRPGLLPNEKRWTAIFVSTAVPLFLAGVVTGYMVMPLVISFLLEFTPDAGEFSNLVEQTYFLKLIMRTMIAIGLGYLIPLLMLMLNVIGVVKGRHLAKLRPFIIFASFVFAALATPAEPYSMIALAVPLAGLMMLVEVIARLNDKRRDKREINLESQDKVLAALSADDESS